MTFINIALERTSRLIGPTWATVPKGESGKAGTRPKLGFRPKVPVKAAGMRMEPPPSVPSASGANRAAMAAAEPPEEPLGVLSLFHGLRVVPVSGLSVEAFQRMIHVVAYDQAALAQAAPFIDALGAAEDLPAHVAAVRVRIPR